MSDPNTDEAFKNFLATYDIEEEVEDAVVAAPEPEAEDPVAIAKSTAARVEMIEMTTEFKAIATPEAQELYADLSEGISDPAQLRNMMKVALKKASAVAPKEEDVERRADEKAKEAYGVAPVSVGAPPREQTAEDLYDELAERNRKGDTHAGFLLWNNLPAEAPASQD